VSRKNAAKAKMRFWNTLASIGIKAGSYAISQVLAYFQRINARANEIHSLKRRRSPANLGQPLVKGQIRHLKRNKIAAHNTAKTSIRKNVTFLLNFFIACV